MSQDNDFEASQRYFRTRGGMMLVQRPELDSGIRLDGRFEGLKTDTACIWKGRPPTLPDGTPYPSLILSASNGIGTPAPPGTTVTIQAEGGAGGGGRTMRQFEVGYGLTAELMVGYYDHLVVKTMTPIAAGFTLYFVWSLELFSGTRLSKYINYTAAQAVAGTYIPIPEGADDVFVQNADTITFNYPSFGTTIPVAVLAGERLPIIGGALKCGVANQLVFRCKPM